MIKGIQNLIDFGIDFYTISAPIWLHLGCQVGTIIAFKIAQVGAQDAPGSQIPHGFSPDLELIDFGPIFNGFFMFLGWIWDRISIYISIL